MPVKNSLRQLFRTPFKAVCFLLLIALSTALLTVGTCLWVRTSDSLAAYEGKFMTIATVEQKPTSVQTVSRWDAEKKDYILYQQNQYPKIYSPSVLMFDGANYITPPEKRSYYGSYTTEYKLNDRDVGFESLLVVEFSPMEDCIPDHTIKIKLTRVLGGSQSYLNSTEFFCDHYNNHPEMIYKDKTYVAYITFQNWVHGDDSVPPQSQLEFSPSAPMSSQYDANGVELENSGGELRDYYELVPGFYETEAGRRFLNLVDGNAKLGRTFPVTGTNRTMLLMPFYEGTAYISSGRDITDAEYADGSRVCLVPEDFAQRNGLTVGDTLHTSFFYTNSRNEASLNFSPRGGGGFGFHVLKANGDAPEVFEENDYEIVGIYDQDPGAIGYVMGGNEVVIPSKSVTHAEGTNVLSYGPMRRETTSFEIPNGSIDTFMAAWEQQHIGDLELTFYDRGYSTLKNGIDNMRNMSLILGISGILTAILLLFLYNYLFVSSRKREVAAERCLGMTRTRCMASLLSGVLLLLVLGSIAGAVGGITMANKVSSSDFEKATFDTSYSDISDSADEAEIAISDEQSPAALPFLCALAVTLAGATIMTLGAARVLRTEPMRLLSESGKDR